MAKCILAALLLVATSCVLVRAWQDPALFAKLDDDALAFEEIESILESAREGAEVGSADAKDILTLKSAHLADCERDQLKKYVEFHYEVNSNKGAVKYIDSKLRSLVELCAKNLDAIQAEYEAKFDQTDREYIKGLTGVLPKVEPPMELGIDQSLKAIDEFIASLPGKKDSVKKAQKMRLLETCRHLVSYFDTLALIVSEAKRRDIPAESNRQASWVLPSRACRELIYKSDRVVLSRRG